MPGKYAPRVSAQCTPSKLLGSMLSGQCSAVSSKSTDRNVLFRFGISDSGETKRGDIRLSKEAVKSRSLIYFAAGTLTKT
jgi:hypothetical protein